MGSSSHHLLFLATHIAKLVQRNKVPYIFDVRDRYPNVLFDLNVISENSLIGRMLSHREKNATETLF